MIPVAGLAGGAGSARSFPHHERGLLGRGEASGRCGDVHAVVPVQQCGDLRQPPVPAVPQVGRRLDRVLQQWCEVAGAPDGVQLEGEQHGQRVLVAPARHAAVLRAGHQRNDVSACAARGLVSCSVRATTGGAAVPVGSFEGLGR